MNVGLQLYLSAIESDSSKCLSKMSALVEPERTRLHLPISKAELGWK